MELSHYVEALRRELGTVTRFANDEIKRAAGMLAEALDAPVRLVLLEALSDAAADITSGADDTVIEVRLARGEPEFVVTHVAADHRGPEEPGLGDGDGGTEDAGTSRITLRLAESLKTRIEAEAAATGVSVNAWLVRAAARAIETGGRQGPGPSGRPEPPRSSGGVYKRISGYARS